VKSGSSTPPTLKSARRGIGTTKKAPGLGDRFVDELENILERIAIAPGRFPYVLPSVRRALLTVFPYAVFFRERGDVIFVISCFHSSRDPKIWQRMDND